MTRQAWFLLLGAVLLSAVWVVFDRELGLAWKMGISVAGMTVLRFVTAQ